MKTLNTLKGQLVLIALLCAFSFQATAASCPATLASKSGKVYSARPGVLTTVSNSDTATIVIRKTAGRAETQVNVYVNNVLQRRKIIEFQAGSYSNVTKRETFRNVQGKTIKVEIINQSVANTFDYDLWVNGETSNMMTTGGLVSGNLVGQTNKTVYTNDSCTNKTRIIVRRTSGNARGNIRVWEKRNGNWTLMSQYGRMLEKNDNTKVITVNSGNDLKVELRNVSVGNRLGYSINAISAD